MKWKYDDPHAIYLNNTSLYVRQDNKFLIIELKPEILDESFKYKKFIRNYIKNNFNIDKKNIINIKFFETYGNLHNYIIILDNTKCLDNGISSMNVRPIDNKFSWRMRLDFFQLDKFNKYINQQDIFNKILDNKKMKVDKNFMLEPDINETTPQYIKKNRISYVKLLRVLTNINFQY